MYFYRIHFLDMKESFINDASIILLLGKSFLSFQVVNKLKVIQLCQNASSFLINVFFFSFIFFLLRFSIERKFFIPDEIFFHRDSQQNNIIIKNAFNSNNNSTGKRKIRKMKHCSPFKNIFIFYSYLNINFCFLEIQSEIQVNFLKRFFYVFPFSILLMLMDLVLLFWNIYLKRMRWIYELIQNEKILNILFLSLIFFSIFNDFDVSAEISTHENLIKIFQFSFNVNQKIFHLFFV